MKVIRPDKDLEDGRASGTRHLSGMSSCRKPGARGWGRATWRERRDLLTISGPGGHCLLGCGMARL